MGFAGFGELAVDFYDGLEADNSRAYWNDNKAVYEQHVHAPMAALLAELEDEFGQGKVFRPHRDLRFSADKTPYKTDCGAIAGQFYAQVAADGLTVCAGYYSTDAEQVRRYREAVLDERRGAELCRLVAVLRHHGGLVRGRQLRRAPRGVDPAHPRIELLRHTTLYGALKWPPDEVLHSPECADRVRRGWRRLKPLMRWLEDHVGQKTAGWG
jgi:uncharacterized protein (TIGR02453 family)